MDDDTSMLSSQFTGWPQQPNEHECVSNVISDPTAESNGVECVTNNEVPSHIVSPSSAPTQVSVCNKCVRLEVELQKVRLVVAKLKKRCSDKTAEIKRVKAAEKRSRLSKSNLEDMVQELKQKKWITAEGQDVFKIYFLLF